MSKIKTRYENMIKSKSFKPNEESLIFMEYINELKEIIYNYIDKNFTLKFEKARLEEENKEMIECLIENLKCQYRNAARCDVLKIPDDVIQHTQYIVEKITGNLAQKLKETE